MHRPIRQDAVLLGRAAGNKTAAAFLRHLRSPSARAKMGDFGYDASED
jgi:hypothetical protein